MTWVWDRLSGRFFRVESEQHLLKGSGPKEGELFSAFRKQEVSKQANKKNPDLLDQLHWSGRSAALRRELIQ